MIRRTLARRHPYRVWSSSPTQKNPSCGRREDPYEQLLRRLDVLVLVDQNLTEAALPAPAKIGVLTQRPHCGEHEVVEVVDSPLGQLAFIVLVDDRQRLAVRMPVGLLGELARRRQQPELDPARSRHVRPPGRPTCPSRATRWRTGVAID